jgi:hypothetical protein
MVYPNLKIFLKPRAALERSYRSSDTLSLKGILVTRKNFGAEDSDSNPDNHSNDDYYQLS